MPEFTVSIKSSLIRTEQSIKSFQKRLRKMDLLLSKSRSSIIYLRLEIIWINHMAENIRACIIIN